MIRGGSWHNSARYSRSAYRGHGGPGIRFDGVGFRLVRIANDSYRVVRGGSWNFNARNLRSAYRNGVGPGNRNDLVGFRLVRIANDY